MSTTTTDPKQERRRKLAEVNLRVATIDPDYQLPESQLEEFPDIARRYTEMRRRQAQDRREYADGREPTIEVR